MECRHTRLGEPSGGNPGNLGRKEGEAYAAGGISSSP